MSIVRKIFGLLLLTAIFVTCLASPGWLLAQADRVELILRLLPGDYYQGITLGQENTLFVELRNNGNTAITNIRLDSRQPERWSVTFRPSSLGSLSAGSTQTFDVIIVPSRTTGRGQYTVDLIAEANETRAVITAFLSVESGSFFWLWVGAGTAALVIAAFIIIFLRQGRR